VTGAASTRWVEAVGPGEAAANDRLAHAIAGFQATFARRGDGRAQRAFHVKSHAGLHATFTVSDGVPEDARFGVFAAPRSFAARVRISNGFSAARADWWPDLMGFSVRLLDVSGPRLVDDAAGAIQDFVALDQPSLPAQDGEQLFVISTSIANLLSAPFVVVRALGFAHALVVAWWSVRLAWKRLWTASAATEAYYSIVPITIGPHAIKFSWRPRERAAKRFMGPLAGRNYVRRDLARRLAGGEVAFDFLVQFYADAQTTPIDGAAAWSEAAAPCVKLGELVLARVDLDDPATHAEERALDGAAFSAWHGIDAHRPIGNIQRTRRDVYAASARYRGSWESAIKTS
jgi:hypothetical protein